MANYSTLTDRDRARIHWLYGIEDSDWIPIRGGAANTSFQVVGTPGPFIVTVVDNTHNLPVGIVSDLLVYLEQSGIRVNAPVRSRRGKLVETTNGHTVMVKPYVEGRCFDLLPEQYLATAGQALASVHLLQVPSTLPEGTRRMTGATTALTRFQDQVFARWVMDGLGESSRVLQLSSPRGIVHGDYFADNLIVESDGQIMILDWETASSDLLLLDVGFALTGLARVEGQYDPNRARQFLEGYQSRRTLTPKEQRYLQQSIVYAATCIGFHRYLRHHIRYPDPSKQHLYREMQGFVATLHERFPAGTGRSA